VLALVRMGDPASRRLVELVTLTPVGVPLAATGTAIALALLVAAHRRALPGLALVVAVTLLGAHVGWLVPHYVPDAAHPGDGDAMVVMTLNIEFADPEALAEAVAVNDVDVLVLLEVTRDRLGELRSTGLTDVLPHAAGVEGDSNDQTIVLRRFRVASSEPVPGGAGHSLVVDLASDAGRVRLVAAHPRPPYLTDVWRSDHAQLLAALSAFAIGEPTIVAGDFNATLAHAPMRRILGLGYDDAVDQVGGGWSPTWPAGGHQRRFGIDVPAFAPIDHVLTSPGLVVTSARAFDVDGADHRAVLASVEWTRS